MTTNESKHLIGASALFSIGGMKFPVTILDSRPMFGRQDVKISPVNGTGEKWVSMDAVTVNGGGLKPSKQ